MATDDTLLRQTVRSYRNAWDAANPDLSPLQRDVKFRQFMNDISNDSASTAMAPMYSNRQALPKRRVSDGSLFGQERDPKRTYPASTVPGSFLLEQHGSVSKDSSSAGRRRTVRRSDTSAMPCPVTIPTRKSGHRLPAPETRKPSQHAQLGIANDFGVSPADCYLAQGLDHSDQRHLATNLFTSPVEQVSEPMTRTNTDWSVSDSFAMFRMDSVSGSGLASGEVMANMAKLSTQPPVSVYPFFPTSTSELSILTGCQQPDLLSLLEMKPSLSRKSHEGPSSPTSSPLSKSFLSTMPASPTGPVKHQPQRALAPKQQKHAPTDPPRPKVITVKGEDGIVKHKVELARTSRQPQQRKTTFCAVCNEQPQGFHGEHELRRHIERQHTQFRKVWICQDVSADGTFLQNCKACRNKKAYGANYNAAAHLRRAHFNPCQNKKGGRGKKSENRGGKGGGHFPPMENLKHWMYEAYEFNQNGRVIIQSVPADVATSVPTLCMTDVAGVSHPQPQQQQQQSRDVNSDYDLPDFGDMEYALMDVEDYSSSYYSEEAYETPPPSYAEQFDYFPHSM